MSWAADEWKADLSHRALQKVEQIEAQMNRLKKESEMKQFKMDSMEQVVQKEKRRVEDEKAQVSALKRETQSLSESCQEIEQKRQKLATEVHTKDSHINALNGQIAHMKKQIEQENSKISNLQTMVDKFEFEQMGHGDKHEKLQADHDKLKQMNQHQTKECAALRAECATLKQKATDMENQMLTLQAENSNMKSQLKDQSTVKESEFKHVSEQLKVEKENMKIMEKKSHDEIKQLKDLLEKKEKEVDKIQTESKSKEDKLANMLKVITIEVQNLKEAGNRKAAQESQAKGKLDQEICELKNNLGEKEQENSKLHKDMKFLRDSLTNAQTSSEAMKTDLKNKEVSIAQQKDGSEKMQKEMDKQIKDLTETNSKLEQRMKSTVNELENVKDNKKNVESSLDKRSRELQDCKADMKNLEGEKDMLEKKLIGLEKTKDTLVSTLSQIKTELEKLQGMNSSFKQEIEELKNIQTGKDREIAQLQSELSHTGDKLNDAQKQLDIVRNELKSSNEDVRQLKSDSETNKMEHEEEKKTITIDLKKAEDRINTLLEKVELVTKEKHDLNISFEKTENSFKECQTELEKIELEKLEVDKVNECRTKENEKLSSELSSIKKQLSESSDLKILIEKNLEDTKFSFETAEAKSLSLEEQLIAAEKGNIETGELLNKVMMEKDEIIMENKKHMTMIEEFKEAIETNQVQCIKDKDTITELNQKVQSLKDALSEKEVSEAELKSKLSHEVDTLSNEVAEKVRSVEELNIQLSHSLEKLEKAQETMVKNESAKTELELLVKTLETNLAELKFAMSEAESLKETHVRSISELDAEVKALKDNLNDKENTFTEQIAELNQQISQLTNSCESKAEEMNTLMTELERANNNNAKIQKNCEEAEGCKSDLQATITKLQTEVEECHFSLEQMKLSEEKVKVVAQQLTNEINILKDNVTSKDLEYSQIKAKLEQEVEELKNVKDGMSSKIRSLECEVSDKSSIVDTLQKTNESVHAEKIDLESRISSFQKENEESKFILQELKISEEKNLSLNGVLMNEIQDLKDKFNKQTQERTETISKLEMEIKELENILDGGKSEINEMKGEVSHISENLNTKVIALEKVTLEKEELQLTAHAFEKKLNELHFSLDESKKENENAHISIAELQKEIGALKDELSDQQMEESVNRAKMEQNLKELQNTVEGYRSEIQQLKIEVDHYMEELSKKQSMLEKVMEEKGEAESSIQRLEKEVDELQFSIKESISADEKSRVIIGELQSEIQTLKDELSDQAMEESVNTAKLTQEVNELKNIAEVKDIEIEKLTTELSHSAEKVTEILGSLEQITATKEDVMLNKQCLEKQIEELQFAINASKLAEEKSQTVIEQLQNEVLTLKDELSDQSLEASVNSARIRQEIKELQNIVEGKDSKIEKLANEGSHLAEELTLKSGSLEQVTAEKNEAVLTTRELQKQIEELQFASNESKSAEAKSLDIIGELKNEIQTLKDELSNQALEESVNTARLMQEVKELQNTAEGNDLEIAKLKDKAINSAEKLHMKSSALEQVTTEKDEAILSKQCIVMQIEELEFAISESRTAEEKSQSENGKLHNEILSLKDKLNDLAMEESVNTAKLSQDVKELQNIIEEKESQIGKLSNEISNSAEQLEKKLCALELVNAEKEDALLNKQCLEKQIEEMQFNISELKSAEEKSQACIAELHNNVQTMKDELSDQAINESVNTAKLTQEVIEFQNIAGGKDSEIGELKSEINHLTKEVNTKSCILDQVTIEKEESEKDKRGLEKQIDELQFVTSNLKSAEEKSQTLISELQLEIQTLKDDMSDQAMEESINMAKLKQDVTELQNTVEGKDSEICEIRNELNRKTETLAKVETSNEEMDSKNTLLESKTIEITAMVEQLQFALDDTKSVVSTHLTNIGELQIKIHTLQDETNRLELELSSAKTHLEQQTEEFKNIIDGKDEEINTVRTELSHVAAKFDESIKSAELIQSQNQELQCRENTLKSVVEELEFKVSKNEEQIVEKSEILNSLQTEIMSLKDELSDLSIEGSATEVKLKQELDEQKNITDGNNLEIQKLQGELNHLRENLDDKLKQLNDTEFEKMSLASEFEKMNIDLSELKIVIEGKDKELVELRNEVNHTTEKLEKSEKQYETLKDQKMSVESSNSKLTTEIEELRFALDEIESAREKQNTKNEKLEMEIQTLKDALSDQSVEASINNAKFNQEIDQQKNVIEGKNGEIEVVQKELKQLSEILEKKVAEIEDLEVSKSEIALKINQYITQVEELNFTLSESCNRETQYVSKIEDLERNVQTLKDDLSDNSIEDSVLKAKLNQELEEMKNMVDGKQKEIEGLESELSHCTDKLNSTLIALESSQVEQTTVNARMLDKDTEIQQVKFAFEESENTKMALSSKIEEINSEINTVKDGLEHHKAEGESLKIQFNLQNEENINIIKGKDENIRQLEAELERARAEGERFLSQMQEVTTVRDEMEKKLSEIQLEIDEVKFKQEVTEKENNKYQDEIMKLQKEAILLKDALDEKSTDSSQVAIALTNQLDQMANIADGKDAANKELSTELAHKVDEYEEKNKALFASQAELNIVKMDLTQLQTEYDEYKLKSESDTAKNEEQIKILEEKIEDFNDQIILLEKEKSDTAVMLHKKISQLQVCQADCEELQEQGQEMEKRIERLERENGTLEKRVTNLTDRLMSSDMEKIDLNRLVEEKQNVIEGHTQEIDSIKEELVHYQEKMTCSEDKLFLLENKVTEAQTEVSQMQQSQESSRFEEEEKIKKLSSLNDKLENAVTETENKMKALEKQFEEQSEVLSLERSKLKDSENEKDYLKEENALLSTRISHLENENELISTKNQTLNEQIGSLQEGEILVKQDIEETRFKLETTDGSLTLSQQKVISMEEEIVEQLKKIEMLSNDKLNFETQVNMACTEIEELKHSLLVERNKEKEQLDAMDTLKNDLSELQDRYNETEAETNLSQASTDSQLKDLQIKLDVKESEIVTLTEERDKVNQSMTEVEEENYKLKNLLEESCLAANAFETKKNELTFAQTEMTNNIESLKCTIDKKESELQSLKDILNDKEVSNTESKTQLELELNQLQNVLCVKTEELEQLREEQSVKTERLSEAYHQMENLQKINLDYETELFKIRQDYCDIKLEFERASKSNALDIELLEDTLSSTQDELKTIQNNKTELEQRLEKAEFSLMENGSDFEEVKKERQKLREKLDLIEEENSDLVVSVDKLSSELNSFKTEKAHFIKKLGETENELQSTQVFSQNLQDKLDHVDNSYKSLQDQIYDLTTKKEELELNLQQANIEVERLKQDLQHTTSRLSTQMEGLDEENQGYREKLLTFEDKVRNRERDITSLEEERNKLEKQIKELESEKLLAVTKMDIGESKIIDLEKSISEKSLKLVQLEEFCSELKSEINDNAREKEMKEKDICSLNNEVEHNRSQLSEIKEDVILKNNSIFELKADVETWKIKFNNSELECQSKTSIIQELEESTEKQTETMLALKEENNKARKEIENLQITMADLEKSIANVEIESSQRNNETDALSADLTEAKENIKCLREEKDSIMINIETLEIEVESWKQKYENMEGTAENLKLSVSSLQEEFDANEKNRKDQENEIQKLQSEVDKLETRIRNIETEKDELEQVVEFTSMESADKDDQLTTLQNEVNESDKKLGELQLILTKVQEQNKNLHDNLSTMEDSLNCLQTEKGLLENELKIKESTANFGSEEIETLQKKLRDSLADVDNFKDMMESLEFENSSLETEKSELEKKLTIQEEEKINLELQIEGLRQSIIDLDEKQEAETLKLGKQMKKEQEKYIDSCDSMNAEIMELKESNSKLCQNENSLKEENCILKAKIYSMELSYSSFDSQKTELSELQGELQNLTGERIELQQKVATQEREKRDLLSQFLALEDQYAGSQKENVFLKQQLDDSTKESEDSMKQLNNVKEQLLSSQSTECQVSTQLETVKLELSQLTEVNVELAGSVDTLRTELTTVQREKDGLAKDGQRQSSLLGVVKKLREGRLELQEKLISLESVKSEQECTIEKLKSEIESLVITKAQVTELQTEVQSLRGKLEEKETKEMDTKPEKEESDQTKEELQKTLEKWASRCSKLNSQLTMEKKNVTKYQDQAKHLKADKEQQVKEKTIELTAELNQAKREATEYLDKYHSLTRRYTQLEQDCAKLQQLLLNSGGTVPSVTVSENRTPTRDVNTKQVKQNTNMYTKTHVTGTQQEATGSHEGEPVVKRLRNSDAGCSPVITKLAEDAEKTPKRKSPRSLSRSKLRAEMTNIASETEATAAKETKISDSQSKSQTEALELIQKKANQSATSTSMPVRRTVPVKSDSSQSGPKGLRPTRTVRSTMTSAEVAGVSVHCDSDSTANTGNRSVINSSKSIPASSDNIQGIAERVTTGSNLSQTSHTQTRSQFKLDTSKSVTKKALVTITNSPVKKQGTSIVDTSEHKITGPQRTLSLKKSPQLLRTRRRIKEELEEQNSQTEQEGDPDCKVS